MYGSDGYKKIHAKRKSMVKIRWYQLDASGTILLRREYLRDPDKIHGTQHLKTVGEHFRWKSWLQLRGKTGSGGFSQQLDLPLI